MQLFSESPLTILSNLVLSNPYLDTYMEDVLFHDDEQQQLKRFHHVIRRFLASRISDHAMVFLGLTAPNGAQSYPKVSVETLKEFIAATMLCTDKNLTWKASDVCSQMCFLGRYYDIVPVEYGIMTPAYWEPMMTEIYQSADKALDELFQKAKEQVEGNKLLFPLHLQSQSEQESTFGPR